MWGVMVSSKKPKKEKLEKWAKRHRDEEVTEKPRKLSRGVIKRIDEGESSLMFDVPSKGQKEFAGTRLRDGTLILKPKTRKKKKKDLW